MARKADIQLDSGDDGTARVWGEVRINLRLGEYESLTVNLGESRSCDDNSKARKATRKAILKECSTSVVALATQVKQEYLDGL